MGNLGTVNAQSAWDFFSRPDFSMAWIDGGASRTWYLAFAAALGGEKLVVSGDRLAEGRE